jgi:hypothetical protein
MLVQVAESDKAAFQLRKDEQGLSVFDPEAVEPPLTAGEILEAFREGSIVIVRDQAFVEKVGLLLVAVPGVEILPERLRSAHFEIRPAAGMTRTQFKAALKELESHENA